MDLVTDIELYETDWAKIQSVGEVLAQKRGTWSLPEAFASEIGERFLEAGYAVEVMLGVSEQAGVNVYSYHLRLTGRVVPKDEEFDHERQAFEVRQAAGVKREGISTDEAWSNVSIGPPPKKK